jgi:Na+-translocating ferredoxin:NAD+ oxidoreductase RnfG subunit
VERRTRLHLLITVVVTAIAFAAHARVFMTQPQALASAYPAGTNIARQALFLTQEQRTAAQKESGVDFDDRMFVRYTGTANDRVIGYAYFDTHRVRTLPETVMIVVNPDGKVVKIEILSFDEPPDYQPKPRWIEQFRGHKLDDDLSLKRSIRPISGASLSGRAIVNASRKILALHRAVGGS